MNINEIINVMKQILSYTIIKILLVIVIAFLLNHVIKSIIKKLFSPKYLTNVRNKQLIQKSRETASKAVLTVIKIIIWVSALLLIISLLKIDTTSIIAGVGFFGLIIGLGIRSFIDSLVTGFFLITDGHISIGDYVRVNDVSGVVIDIGIRNITLRTNTGELNIQPVTSVKAITNYSIDNNHVLVNLTISTEYEFMKIMNNLNKTIKEMNSYLDLKKDIYIDGFNIFQDSYEIRIACTVVEETNMNVQAIIKHEIIKSLKNNNIDLSK